ncbi:COMM domain-containing protein 6-like [Hydractinia symbiolongicarpus]|uniref:COMM domain-containing protein 6-like n=1 Tax=Hydractinia symbiolongicarpus TaxID=13093 RepID=UPI00254F60CD|nr:COMM domain-containing protein 6-like [Hydractinia symbiolongicarpus]
MVFDKNQINIGELTKFDWKISMATSSNTCKNFDSPMVTLVLWLKDLAGVETRKSIELNLSEFQNFSKQLKEARSVLATS